MELKQVKGSTWVIGGWALMPIYLLDEHRCILMDTGLREEREALDAFLQEKGLIPAGILCSHAHIDHCVNNRYFQEKYQIPVALSAPEAGMCSSILNLKSYRLIISPGADLEDMAEMVHTPDVVIPYQDGTISLAGARFRIITTPGHSSGHICAITPDNVCYAGDAIMSRETLDAKLPYALAIQTAMDSRQRLRDLGCDYFVMAHRGICAREEIGDLIDENHELILRRAREIRALITEPMDFSHVCGLVCQYFKLLSKRPSRALYYERNIRFFIEFLVDRGELAMEARQGVAYYLPKP